MRGLLVPAEFEAPIREVTVGPLHELQKLVGGFIEAVRWPGPEGVVPYFNEEGKLMGLPVNLRATDMLHDSLAPRDFICGDMVLLGFDSSTGQEQDLPQSIFDKYLDSRSIKSCVTHETGSTDGD